MIHTGSEEIPIRVLVVDDEQQVGEFLCNFLSSKGYEAFYASNGEDALNLIKRARPHIALLDIRMSGMSGLELLREVREIDPKMGAIMVTAFNEEEVGRKALQLGAIDYIAKPIDVEYLETSLTVKLASMLE